MLAPISHTLFELGNVQGNLPQKCLSEIPQRISNNCELGKFHGTRYDWDESVLCWFSVCLGIPTRKLQSISHPLHIEYCTNMYTYSIVQTFPLFNNIVDVSILFMYLRCKCTDVLQTGEWQFDLGKGSTLSKDICDLGGEVTGRGH